MPVAMVTGAASGLGEAVCERLLNAGWCVVAADVNAGGLAEAASRHAWPLERCRRAVFDVRDAAAWEREIAQAVGQWGQLDALLNVAGYLKPGYVHETGSDEVDRHFDINVKGVVFGAQAAAKVMVPRHAGRIINIASLAGVAPIPGIALYSASKFAVRGFSLALAQELAPHGVKVSVICPDAIETPMLSLQESYSEAAMTFSGEHVLTTAEVTDAVMAALDKAPLEVLIPGYRGALAKLGSALPRLSGMLGEHLRRKGLSKQAARRTPPSRG